MPDSPPPQGALDALVDRFLAYHVAFHPIDATFMGLAGGDERLPPADDGAPGRERDALVALRRELDHVPVPDLPGARLDARTLRAALGHAAIALDHRPRFRQPSWYTGEAAFALISLLLPTAPAGAAEALPARLAAIPGYLAAGMRHLAGQPTPPDWAARARREIVAIRRLLAAGLPRHPLWRETLGPATSRADAALAEFAASLDSLPPGDPACGRDFLAFLMREIHGFAWSPEEAVEFATEEFRRLGDRLDAEAARIDPSRGWQGQLAALGRETVEPASLPSAYRTWHERALEGASGLVTPATEYGLAFRPLPEWAREVAGELYFLSYRPPPAIGAGAGSIYWTAPAAQPLVTIKQTHAVHHGSIGHHTQNTRARAAASRLARLAGTDGASALSWLTAGTMAEGWACYATLLMGEVDGFYTPAESLAAIASARRDAGSVLADVRLHTGEWSLARMQAFYRDEGGFPPARVEREAVRNSIFPASRLMYFLGVEQIRALRAELGGEPRSTHDALLACGHVPIAWAAEEVRRARRGAGAAR